VHGIAQERVPPTSAARPMIARAPASAIFVTGEISPSTLRGRSREGDRAGRHPAVARRVQSPRQREGVAGAVVLLLFLEAARRSLLPSLLSYATGTLLAAACLPLQPPVLAHHPARRPGRRSTSPPHATWCPFLALSTASFIDVAVADLVPTVHRTTGLTRSRRQLLFILAGIVTIALFRFHH
jgi:hypothetical protein